MNIFIALWWIFLAVIFVVTYRLIGYRKKITTFTFLLPLLFIVFGIFSPFSYKTLPTNVLANIGAKNRPTPAPLLSDAKAKDPAVQKKDVAPIAKKKPLWLNLQHPERFFFSLALTFIFIPFGVFLANRFVRYPDFSRSMSVPSTAVSDSKKTSIYLWVIFAVSLISIVQIYASGLQFHMSDYVLGKWSYAEYAAHRYAFARATAGWAYAVFDKLPYALAPLAIVIAFNIRTLKMWQRFLFFFVLSFALIQPGHKLPLIYLVGLCLLSWYAIRHKLDLTARVIVVCAAIFLATLFLILPLFYWMQGTLGYYHGLYWSYRRVFVELGRYLPLYFEVFPDMHPFLLGKSSQFFSIVTGQMSEHIWPIVYIPREILGLQDTSFPTLYIGEAWADFGYAGVIMASTAVGFLLQAYNRWYYGKTDRPLEETALFLSVVVGALHLMESNFLTALSNYGLLSGLLIYVLIRKTPVKSEVR